MMFLDLTFFWLNLGVAGAMLMAVVLLAAEAGFRLAQRASGGIDDQNRSQVAAIKGASIAVVGLLLGFTFSMSASRFESRKLIVVNEANAIGTAYLRARLLQEPQRQQLEACLRRYVDVWLELCAAGADVNTGEAATKELGQLQERLWTVAAEAARQNPNAVTLSLLLQSLNDIFDRQSELMAAVANRVPGVVLLLLTVTISIALGMVGYGCGLAGRRNFGAVLTLSVLIVAIILTILDFDRPRRGLVQISPAPMLVLRQGMNTPSR